MTRLRRSRFLFLRARDDRKLDLARLLRGTVSLSRGVRVVALAVLDGAEHPLTAVEWQALQYVPAGEWIDGEDAVAAGADPGALDRLAGWGILLDDRPGEPYTTFRRREERLEAEGWHPLAALFHFMTRWRDVAAQLPETGVDDAYEQDREIVEHMIREWGMPPRHVHAVPGLATPHALPSGERDGALHDALLRRRTTRGFDPGTSISQDELAALLRLVWGLHGYLPIHDGIVALKKTSPSGGALHPIEVYPLVLRVGGLESGIYHYRVDTHALVPVLPLTREEAEALAVSFTAGQVFLRDAAVLFIMTARFHRSFWKYRQHEQVYRTLYMDAGHLSQTFYLLCADLGLGAMITAAINGTAIEERLGIDGYAEGAIAICACGKPDPTRDLDPEFVPWNPGDPLP